MTKKAVKNVGASIRDRLRNEAKRLGNDFNLILERYALERVLYRLSCSEYKPQFILKGGMLLSIWATDPYRSTRDADFLSYGEPTGLAEIFRKICQIEQHDGLTFDLSGEIHSTIKEDQEYEGIRLKFKAFLDSIEIGLQFDIGFGDHVTPEPEIVEYPVLLNLPKPILHVYPKETVVAEKFEAMVKLGFLNSRMKDYDDLYYLSSNFSFDGEILAKAIKNTFARRKTEIPTTLPEGLSDKFAQDSAKLQQWKAFLNRKPLKAEKKALGEIIDALNLFLMPPTQAISTSPSFTDYWNTSAWVAQVDSNI
jgi:predicted nucleotidyltransferase component of viral defense system